MNAPRLTCRTSDAESTALCLGISVGPDKRSRVTERNVSFPWSVGRGYVGNPGEPVMVIPQMAGAGLLPGDRVRQRIHVGNDAALHLVSAGATLTYGSPGAAHSISDWSVELEAGAQAFLVSEPYVLLDDAQLQIRQALTVSPDATFVGCEGVVCAERSNHSHWQTETVVRRPDGPHLFTDRQRASMNVVQLHADLTGAWSAFGTVLVVSPNSETGLNSIAARIGGASDRVWIGLSPTRSKSGMCLRIAAQDGQTLRSAMMDLVMTLMLNLKRA